MSTNEKVVLTFILLLYMIIALIHCGNQGYWHDEIYSLAFMKGISAYTFEGSTLELINQEITVSVLKEFYFGDAFYVDFNTLIKHEGHPPIYFILLKLWSLIFGCSEVGLRSFSVFCGLGSTIVLFRLGLKQFESFYVKWLGLGVLLFNPFLFYFFTETRMYALSFLLASLSFYYWIQYSVDKKVKSLNFVFFITYSTLLLYTHYYSIFFLSSLALLELIRGGLRKSILIYSVPIILFLPWGIMIKEQLSFHTIHWTDGFVPFDVAILGFLKSIYHLFIAPMSTMKNYEIVVISIFFIMLAFVNRNQLKYIFIFTIILLAYFLQIFLFDLIIDHHSILVPRYYIFVIIFITGFISMTLNSVSKRVAIVFTLLYCVIGGISIQNIFFKTRAPKQMYREVAGYIDNRFSENRNILVVEPSGPMIWSLAYYLNKNYKIVQAKDFSKSQTELIPVFIDENLGVSYREHKFHNKIQNELQITPFVGVILYH